MCCLIACLCPPIAVLYKRGCSLDFCVSILLTILGWIPGCLFACCIINAEEKNGPTVINTIHVNAPPAAAPASHVTVNMPMPQYGSPPYGGQMQMPMPGQGPMYAPPPPPGIHAPPPMYSSAPPMYGEGDMNVKV